ncbi:MAG: sucrose-6-phosphate hydrolase, partial [Solobacterium sp.]|nr:sucrose-6-phosphate hydrolase [Solobacterium sp.]
MEPKGDEFYNKFNSVYLIGDLDLETLTFTPDGPMHELDRGFDFYAPQCASQNVYS